MSAAQTLPTISVIRDDAEAIATAHRLAAEFRPGAAARDRDRCLPYAEIDRFSQSGLWAITVPKDYGGAGVSAATLAEVTAIISAADGSIGQIPQNHFFVLEALRLTGTAEQKTFWFGRVLGGERIGNALSEAGGKTVHDYKTTIRPTRDGKFLLNGRKFYSTGALFAHWIAVLAKDEQDRVVFAFLRQDTTGVTLIDDWSGFGQRTTGSGTTVFENAVVEAFAVIPFYESFESPTSMGPFGQIIHAAIDIGIGRGALAETISFVRTKSRPWIDSGQEKASDDPYTIAAIGDLSLRQNAADALLARAGRAVDRAALAPNEETVAEASIAVAEARAWGTEAALAAANKLHELAGARSTLAEHGLDRYWRNVRVHSLHDPVRWKYAAIGNYYLNGIKPPRHGAI
ncbi:MAG TPA: SfnB family sulfur acquisition oxidoreductase [Acidisoma sp.]|jgi:SfnB family sulfur acquisition oxidoreductase|uniref:SfnB family sulfur acquisition oxidoreductase n=1 Tax=Acidisoma sp. TaxID=1872115 RepID=UPI002BFAB555|nr:SfnB family sulfur acquisition oxidoreductase [Acidisoma sp.]HTI03483.1 SfnB family sulfur acquisition oxidoreductase [Acidisoma sp.]